MPKRETKMSESVRFNGEDYDTIECSICEYCGEMTPYEFIESKYSDGFAFMCGQCEKGEKV